MTRRAAFLDRDGTLNARPRAHHYVERSEDFDWLPGAAKGACLLAQAGFALVIVSNQRGVARGLVSRETLEEIEELIQAGLGEHGCAIESFHYCPHDHDARCDCRKPKPGMLLDAARELELNLERSWMIGDSETDVQAGHAAGCRTALLATGDTSTTADLVAPTLLDVSRRVRAGD
jgi:D-glycero-D-manno-heptose 1,7-bisphosphate phosphatase